MKADDGLDLSHDGIGKDMQIRARSVWQLLGCVRDGDVLVGCIDC